MLMNGMAKESASPGSDSLKSPAELLPEVYAQLRHIATVKLSHEKPDQTLQATELVHEAWLRVAGCHESQFRSRAEFFGAAARSMRRILVERARRKNRRNKMEGGERVPLEFAK
jgi:RNA polymerase sigma factor (TIGR02999 family)